MLHASSSGFPDGASKRKKRSSLDSEVSLVSSDRSLSKKHKNESSILLQESRGFDKVKAQPRRATRSSIASNSSLGASVRDDVFYDNESEQTNQGVSKKGKLFEKISVPQDCNSLLWSIALAYLIPVKNDNELFKERYEKLFGNENSNELKDVQRHIKSTSSYDSVDGNSTLKRLVTETFREKVIDKVRSKVRAKKITEKIRITIYDIYRNTNSRDDFVDRFSKKFNHFIEKHKVDVKKLKLADKDELNKISRGATSSLKDLVCDVYLEHMKQAGFYGGKSEIVAIREILESNIYVLPQASKKQRYTGYSDQINLFLNKEKYYNFGLIKVEALATAIKEGNDRHYFKQAVKLTLDKGVGASIKDHYDKTVEEFVESFSNKENILDLQKDIRSRIEVYTINNKRASNKKQKCRYTDTSSSQCIDTTLSSPDSVVKRVKFDSTNVGNIYGLSDKDNSLLNLEGFADSPGVQFTSTPNDPISLQFFAHDQGLSNEKPSGSKVRQSGRMGSDTNAPRMVDEQCQTEKQKLLVNVPGDGSCLFWSVALAYLTLAKNDNELFKERYKKLSGDENPDELNDVQNYIKRVSSFSINDGKLNLNNIDKENPTLKKLVTETFRKRVADTIYDEQGKLDYTKRTVTIHDIFESMNGGYITDFVKNFRNRFQDEILKCGIDIEKLKTLVEVKAELNKINNFPEDKLHELSDFVLESYKECLSNQGSWAGEYEMKAIEDLLTCGIWVREGEDALKHIRKPEFSSDLGLRGGQSKDSIRLVRIDKGHYNFELDEETLKQTGGIFKDSEISASASNSQESSVAGKPRRRTRHVVNYSIDNSGDDYDSSGSEYTPSIKRSNSDSQSPLEDVTLKALLFDTSV